MLPPAMSVRCTMTRPPMRTALGERDYCFFVVRRVSRDAGHFGHGGVEAPVIRAVKVRRAEHQPIDKHPRPHSAARSVTSSAFGIMWTSSYQRARKAAAQSGIPRGPDLLFVGLIKAA